jgi:hypothetical protein
MNSTITCKEIIESFNKHGDDFIVIDTINFRESGNKAVKYFDIKFMKKDKTVVPPRIKFFNQEINNRIKDTKERDYETVKTSIQSEGDFGKAIEIVCNAFSKKIKDMKAKNIINDEEEESDAKTVVVQTCKTTTPMQKFAKDKDGNRVTFDRPLFWFVPAFRRYKDEEITKLPKLPFNYKGDGKKVYVKEFDFEFYNLDSLDSETGRPNNYKLDDEKVNNTNVQKVLTKGSLISGILQMQVIASKQSLSLNTKFASKLYVKTNHDVSTGGNYFDDDDFDLIMKGAGKEKLVKKVEKQEIDEDTEVSQEADGDDEEEEISGLENIQGLSL